MLKLILHYPLFQLVGVSAADGDELVRAEHLELVTRGVATRHGLYVVGIDDESPVAGKHIWILVKYLPQLLHRDAQGLTVNLIVLQYAQVGIVAHRLNEDDILHAHLKHSIVCIARERNDIMRFPSSRVIVIRPLFQLPIDGLHHVKLLLQPVVL